MDELLAQMGAGVMPQCLTLVILISGVLGANQSPSLSVSRNNEQENRWHMSGKEAITFLFIVGLYLDNKASSAWKRVDLPRGQALTL